MIVNSARFVVSNSSVASCPDDQRHEYAFIGRSNVGKSSLINMLTGNRKLAMTSSTPGKTTLINHFLINDSWYIVDLPGYGFAMRSKEGRREIERIIREYILYRPQMTNLFLLVDVRHDPQKIDLEFMEWLGENEVPFSIVFTKLDKLSPTAGKRQMEKYCTLLLENWEELPPVFATSSTDGRGRAALLDYIEELNKLPVGSAAEEEGEENAEEEEKEEHKTNEESENN